jgi:hypothetical protein
MVIAADGESRGGVPQRASPVKLLQPSRCSAAYQLLACDENLPFVALCPSDCSGLMLDSVHTRQTAQKPVSVKAKSLN